MPQREAFSREIEMTKKLYLHIAGHKFEWIGNLADLHKAAESLTGKLFESHITTKERTVVAFQPIAISKGN